MDRNKALSHSLRIAKMVRGSSISLTSALRHNANNFSLIASSLAPYLFRKFLDGNILAAETARGHYIGSSAMCIDTSSV